MVEPKKVLLERYYQNNKLHREDGPAETSYDYDGHKSWKKHELYYQEGLLHRDDGPAKIIYKKINKISEETYYKAGAIHRDNGPAYIEYQKEGKTVLKTTYFDIFENTNPSPKTMENAMVEEYYQDSKKHRIGGPAEIEYYENGNIKYGGYCINGNYHREDGPAKIYYFTNGNIEREEYVIDNKLHKEDGPALVEYDINRNIVSEFYWVNGNRLTEKQIEFRNERNLWKPYDDWTDEEKVLYELAK